MSISCDANHYTKAENLSAQCMGYLGATLTQVFTRVRRANVSLRDFTVVQMGNGATQCGSARRILGILKKVSGVETRHRTRRVDFRGSQRPDKFARYGHRRRWGEGADEIARIERMYISLLMSKNL